ncbi:OmpP1/FadL family transporter [Halomonas sp. McH1-25]|uniref:OmpP1/FadL family transporter n=1 Tax=unclassified Halomonas TaxID=2609666 RepID=UPI001EF4A7FA|nr:MULTISPECIES: outer membrane protein transport protein [unclassified Halomonas]MCG7601693.1 OmpP1/FadL family transporter [Halomonas sp. McH1-25]MCP1343314.1 OmpP1/FadL family transporter [Halomonas sp. FL8]MCP1360670.1 OmpP1/FadL family transporter [Halomonas sp. BBD45]MCP1364754.1 OmpP1/FadL family transporter [Halomonas sp. BBD48]
MQNKINKLTVAIAVAAAMSGQAVAGGFQLNEQSVSGQGYSHAGRSSNVQDATIVFGNPAGMSFLDRAQVTAGATYLDVSTDIDTVESSTSIDSGLAAGGAPSGVQFPLGPVSGSTDGDMVPGTLVPFAFYAQPISDRLHFGFGVYAPFGSKTDYEDDFQGRYFGDYTEVKVVSAQPTLSYKINDQLAIGAGVTYNQVEGELRRQIPNVPQPFSTASDVDARVDGDDEAWGYNIGVIYRPVPETTLGLTYRSKVDYTLKGDFRATAPNGTVVRQDDASLDLTTPETVNFSITQEMTDRLTLMAGASWARWSRFERILVNGTQGDEITNEAQNYSNAWNFAVGAQYELNPQWILRTGLALDNTPTNDEDRSVRIPSDDRRIFSVGAGWTPIPDFTVDLAYSYLTERSTRISQSRDDSLNGFGATSYTADYKNEAHGFGAQATYRF